MAGFEAHSGFWGRGACPRDWHVCPRSGDCADKRVVFGEWLDRCQASQGGQGT